MNNKSTKDWWIEMSVREICTQTHFAGLAFANIIANTTSKRGPSTDIVYMCIHSFLSHCANVSKMLRANDGGKPPKSIGDILGISCNSLIHQRKFRNHLEHYDERLKNWIKKFSAGANIGTYNIGPRAMFSDPNFIRVTHYDPSDQCFTFTN